jgi:cytochrome P450
MSQWVVHRDPRYYDNPDSFISDRWTPEFEKQLPKYAYFPFGGGPRICIGNNFAMMEAILIVATIAQNWRMELISKQTLELEPSITVRPKHGIKVRIIKK